MRILILATALCVSALAVSAEEKADTGKAPAKAEAVSKHAVGAKDAQTSPTKEDEAKAKPVGNTICPVSGQKIGAMGEGTSVVYKGHKVGLCCSGCTKTFMKDPEKYLGKAQKEAEQAKGKEPEGKKAGEKPADEKM
jgi:hypothetical protein